MSNAMEHTAGAETRPLHCANVTTADALAEALWRKYVLGFLALLAALCLAIGTLNYVVNPQGLYSTHLVKTPLWNTRHEKIMLMKRTYCQAIILGSSHAMKISPTEVKDLTGFRTFNAAVDMATVEDEFALLRAAVEGNRWSVRFVLVAIDPETFNPSTPTDPTLRRDSELSRYVPESRSAIVTRWEAATALLSVEQTSTSFQTLNWFRNGAPRDHHFDADGYLHYDTLEGARLSDTYDLKTQVNSTKGRITGRYRTITALSAKRQQLFIDMLHYCHVRGIEVNIFIPPLHPSIRAALSTYHYDRLLAETIDFATPAAQRYSANFYDLSNLGTFRGHVDAFYDGEHVDEVNARLIAIKLLGHRPGNAVQ
jgi:hypothetical protein